MKGKSIPVYCYTCRDGEIECRIKKGTINEHFGNVIYIRSKKYESYYQRKTTFCGNITYFKEELGAEELYNVGNLETPCSVLATTKKLSDEEVKEYLLKRARKEKKYHERIGRRLRQFIKQAEKAEIVFKGGEA